MHACNGTERGSRTHGGLRRWREEDAARPTYTLNPHLYTLNRREEDAARSTAHTQRSSVTGRRPDQAPTGSKEHEHASPSRPLALSPSPAPAPSPSLSPAPSPSLPPPLSPNNLPLGELQVLLELLELLGGERRHLVSDIADQTLDNDLYNLKLSHVIVCTYCA
jgi:hypothetical protein